jgi:hypothetical protein
MHAKSREIPAQSTALLKVSFVLNRLLMRRLSVLGPVFSNSRLISPPSFGVFRDNPGGGSLTRSREVHEGRGGWTREEASAAAEAMADRASRGHALSLLFGGPVPVGRRGEGHIAPRRAGASRRRGGRRPQRGLRARTSPGTGPAINDSVDSIDSIGVFSGGPDGGTQNDAEWRR